jgi:hypothetical protein
MRVKPKKRRKQGEEKPGQRRRLIADLEAQEQEDELRLARAAAAPGDEDHAPAWQGDDQESLDQETKDPEGAA